MACTRSLAPVLAKIRLTCVLTVATGAPRHRQAARAARRPARHAAVIAATICGSRYLVSCQRRELRRIPCQVVPTPAKGAIAHRVQADMQQAGCEPAVQVRKLTCVSCPAFP